MSCSNEQTKYDGEGKIRWNDVPLTFRKGFTITFPENKADKNTNSRTFSTKNIPITRSPFKNFPYEFYIYTNQKIKNSELLNMKCSIILNKGTQNENILFNEKISNMSTTEGGGHPGYFYHMLDKSFFSPPKNFLFSPSKNLVKNVTVVFSISQENIQLSYNLVIACARGL